MVHETRNLAIDEDGDVWLRFVDEDGESDVERIGHVDSSELDVDNVDLHDEFLELQTVWREMACDRRSYEAGMGTFWGR